MEVVPNRLNNPEGRVLNPAANDCRYQRLATSS